MTGKIVGKVIRCDIDSVDPNDWNMNVIVPHKLESLRRGLSTDGWLIAQSMTIWGTDEKGNQQNKIIDGEHRWRLAKDELGFKKAPMMFLNGITRAQAIAHTIKFIQRSGSPDADRMRDAVRSIHVDIPEIEVELGFTTVEIDGFMDSPDVDPVRPDRTASSQVSKVQLVFDEKQKVEWNKLSVLLMRKYKLDSVSETALEALRRVSSRYKG